MREKEQNGSVGQARRSVYYVSLYLASLGARRCASDSCSEPDVFLFSGTRWAARSRPSTMSWRDASASCTCSSIRTGRREPTRPAPRRGSANKTPKTEVPPKLPPYNLLLHYYLDFGFVLFFYWISNLRAVHITRTHLCYFFTFLLLLWIRPVAGEVRFRDVSTNLAFQQNTGNAS